MIKNGEVLYSSVFDVVNRESGSRHGTAFLGVFKRAGKQEQFIVTAGHVVYHRSVNIRDLLGKDVPVRFHQLQDRDIAVAIPPDQLSHPLGIPVSDIFPRQKQSIFLASRRNDRIIEKKGWTRGRLLPGVLFYQFEEGDGGDGTSGSPVLNEQLEVVAVHTGSGHRLVDGSTDGRALGELLVPTIKPNAIERTKMSLNILAFFLGF